MKTKLVYVLTCGEEGTYIEQALISAYSARYHNPDAHIVLIVDDKTNELLVGKRAEVLEYVTEKVVVDLPDDMLMRERSRYIKTSVRELISGDFLFIDSDTIVCGSLSDIDECDYNVGAVLDTHLSVNNYPAYLKSYLKSRLDIINVDVETVRYYFSSGVMYVKDNEFSHSLYKKWHELWYGGLSNGFIGDQPYLLKADLKLGNVIKEIPGVWNTVMYAYPTWIKDARILHFSPHKNMCVLFDSNFLSVIRKNGLESYKSIVLNHDCTYIANIWQKPFSKFIKIYKGLKIIKKHSPESLQTYLIEISIRDIVVKLFEKNHFAVATLSIFINDIKINIRKAFKKQA